MIPKEMKYNLHFGDVRGDVLTPPHRTNTSLFEENQAVKKFGQEQTKFALFLSCVKLHKRWLLKIFQSD